MFTLKKKKQQQGEENGLIDQITAQAPWFRGSANADILAEELEGKSAGTFVIVEDTSLPQHLTLIYRSGDGITKRMQITSTSEGVRLTSSDAKFSSVLSLVANYSIPNAEIGVPLLVDSKTQKLIAKDLKKKQETITKNMRLDLEQKQGTMKNLPGSKYKPSDVADLFEVEGLGEYAPMIKRNKINGVMFLNLTEERLRELGVLIPEHRTAIMNMVLLLMRQLDPQRALSRMQELQQHQQLLRQHFGAEEPIGLIAREIEGKLRFFDTDTGMEIFDIGAHQQRKHIERNPPQPIQQQQIQKQPETYNDDFYGSTQDVVPAPTSAPGSLVAVTDSSDVYTVLPSRSNPIAAGFAPPPIVPRGQDSSIQPPTLSPRVEATPPPIPGERAPPPIPGERAPPPIPGERAPPPIPGERAPPPIPGERAPPPIPGERAPPPIPGERAPPLIPGEHKRGSDGYLDESAKMAAWFVPGTDALQLAGQAEGSFRIVQTSSEQVWLHYISPGGAVASICLKIRDNFISIPRSSHQFSTLSDFVSFYSGSNPEIPYLLLLPQEQEVDHLKRQWYVDSLPKENARQLIEHEQNGSFIICKDSNAVGSYLLLYVADGRIREEIISATPTGLTIAQNSITIFPDLRSLVAACVSSQHPSLACKLRLPRPIHAVLDTLFRRKGNLESETQDDVIAQARLASRMMAAPDQRPSWDMRHTSREDALAALRSKQPGGFVVRSSGSHFAALSVRMLDGTEKHMHIERDSSGIFLKKTKLIFPTLDALISNYASDNHPSIGIKLCP